MLAVTHVAIGLTGAAAFCHLTGAPITPASVLCIMIGSLAPDLDGDGLVTRSGTIFGVFLPWRARRVIDGVLAAISKALQLMFPHRTVLHWACIPVILGAWALYRESLLLWWFSFGYLLHILADACTPYGVPLFAPISFTRIRFARIPTGSRLERFLLIGIIIAGLMLGYPLLPKGVR